MNTLHTRWILGVISLFIALLWFPSRCFAKIGVGIGTGKIQVDQKLRSGMIYTLPSITVINTGDEASEYEMVVAFQQDQPELRPAANWFIFSPTRFRLEPGKTQVVAIKINLPLAIAPGNYFAYLEAHPVATIAKGATSIGVAAAGKLYFTVVPASVFMGLYYKISSFWQVYTPWPQRVVGLMVVVAGILVAKKFLNIQINVKQPAPMPNPAVVEPVIAETSPVVHPKRKRKTSPKPNVTAAKHE